MDRSPKTFKKPVQRQTTLSKGGDLNRLNVQKTENKGAKQAGPKPPAKVLKIPSKPSTPVSQDHNEDDVAAVSRPHSGTLTSPQPKSAEAVPSPTETGSQQRPNFVMRPRSVVESPQPAVSVVDRMAADGPTGFDSKAFLNELAAFGRRLDVTQIKQRLKHQGHDVTGEGNSSDVTLTAEVVHEALASLDRLAGAFKVYVIYVQEELKSLRDSAYEIKDYIYSRISNKTQDTYSGKRHDVTADERQAEAKMAELHREMARLAEELLKASKLSIDTEVRAREAGLAADKARDEAEAARRAFEAEKRAAEAARAEEEERQRAEASRRAEEARRAEERRKAEEERRAALKRPDDLADPNSDTAWRHLPTEVLLLPDHGEFDQGVGCVLRAERRGLDELIDRAKCHVIDLLCHVSYPCGEGEELVSNVIHLQHHHDNEVQTYVMLPHCFVRFGLNMSREVIMKAEVSPGHWVELHSTEVTLDDRKDLKFVQAPLTQASNYAVVSRLKRDYLHLTKKGGDITSTLDQRIVFAADKDTFAGRELFVLQLQPVDSGVMSEVKRLVPEATRLITSSAVLHMQWTSKTFDSPVAVTLPVPANPAKLRKLAAAKEAKMNRKGPPTAEELEAQAQAAREAERQRKRDAQKVVKQVYTFTPDGKLIEPEEQTDAAAPLKPIKWHMGEYGTDDEENDVIHVLRRLANGKWALCEDARVTESRLDIVRFHMTEPMDRVLVLRMMATADTRTVLTVAEAIDDKLTSRTVLSVLRRRSEDPHDFALCVTTAARAERVNKRLEEEGYDVEYDVSKTFDLFEGDVVSVHFRGNVDRCVASGNDDSEEGGAPDVNHVTPSAVFNSQQLCCFRFRLYVKDKYLQKAYKTYRGFVRVSKGLREVSAGEDRWATATNNTPGHHGNQHTDSRLFWEHMVQLPKVSETAAAPQHSEDLPSHHFNDPRRDSATSRSSTSATTTVTFKMSAAASINSVGEGLFGFLASELGHEWIKVARHLNVKRARLQAIKAHAAHSTAMSGGRDGTYSYPNGEGGDVAAKYEMLVNWAKRQPRGVNKMEALKEALMKSGRIDLAQHLGEVTI